MTNIRYNILMTHGLKTYILCRKLHTYKNRGNDMTDKKIWIASIIAIVLLLLIVRCGAGIAPTYITNYCKQYHVEPALAMAIARVESWLQDSPKSRYEPHLRDNLQYNTWLTKEEQHDIKSYCSLGTMQVLVGTAKWLGYKGTPGNLRKPINNCKYGVKYIRYLIRKYYQIDKVILSYNAGNPYGNNTGYLFMVAVYYKENKGKINIDWILEKYE